MRERKRIKARKAAKKLRKNTLKKKTTENTEAFHIWLVIELLLSHAV